MYSCTKNCLVLILSICSMNFCYSIFCCHLTTETVIRLLYAILIFGYLMSDVYQIVVLMHDAFVVVGYRFQTHTETVQCLRYHSHY